MNMMATPDGKESWMNWMSGSQITVVPVQPPASYVSGNVADTDVIDRFVEATNKLLSYEEAKPRDIQSLQNWLDIDGCVIHDDRAYLSSGDLFYVAPPADNAMARFESWVEFKLKRVLWYRQVCSRY